MKLFEKLFLLRLSVALILIMHSVPGMLNNGISGFGEYLNISGFSPVGLPLAWLIKISHVLCAVCLVLNRYVVPASMITIAILMAGIVMVHFKEGWFVVGGGQNGIEYNFLLICVLLTIMYPSYKKKE